MLSRIQLIRNIGQFDSVNGGAAIALTKLALIYAENGRGKTTRPAHDAIALTTSNFSPASTPTA